VKKIDSIRQKLTHALRLDRAVRFVWYAGPGMTMASLVLVFIQGVLPLITLYIMKLIVDAVAVSVTGSNTQSSVYQIGLFIALGAGVALITAVCRSIGAYVQEAQSLAVTNHISDVLHAKSTAMDLAYYENPKFFDTLRRAQQEGPYRPTRIVNGLTRLGQNSISLAAMVGLLFSFHWVVGMILFAAALPGVLVRMKFSGRMYHWQRMRTPDQRKAAYYNWILTGDVHAKEIRLFGLGDLFIQRFSVLQKKLSKERLTIARNRSVADMGAQTAATLAIFGSLFLIAVRTVQGIITLGDMVMYFQAFQRGLGYLRDLLGDLAGLYEDNLFVSNFYEFLDLEPKIKEPPHPIAFPRPLTGGIVLDHVSFQYPGTNREVLKDISLRIAPGEVVALVGENGSGKTTLIKLLCRLYDPTGGNILMDGIDLKQFNTSELRRELSVIFQDYVQYHLTALENIWLGNTDHPPEVERIREAAQKAGADNLISGLPQGYNTMLGKWFEHGEELSMGEWQKIALARSFLRNAQIIVLDEPTSALDAKSEYEVFNDFKHYLNGRSAVLISHRFSTVKMADRIFVFDGGKIKENGTHDQLMQLGGNYAYYFEKQAQHYK